MIWLTVLLSHLSADFGFGGEDAVISVHVKSWRRDERSETSDEVQGLEQDGFSAVFPRLLEAVAQTAITVFFDSFERERWASDISIHALESLSVATIDGDSSVSRVDASRCWRRGSGTDSEFGKNTSGGVFVFGDFDDAHTTRALRTEGNVDFEHALEKPDHGCLEGSGGGARYPSSFGLKSGS